MLESMYISIKTILYATMVQHLDNNKFEDEQIK